MPETVKQSFRLIWLFCIATLVLNKYGLAQSAPYLKKVACDCDSAVKIPVFKKAGYGFTQAPDGFGKVMEIKARSNSDKTAFEKEHHSAWYLLEFHFSGELIFDITPRDKKDDYDFLLFPYKDSLTCKGILKEQIKPVRGNLSRNDTNNMSITGLSDTVKNEFNGKGIGLQFSKSITVKSGEKYLLVLDNVYEGGKGHKLNFSFIKDVNISGQVVNEEGKPLAAEVTLYDDKGQELKRTTSNAKGEYKMDARIIEYTDYSLTYIADNSFVGAETINTKNLKDPNSFANIKTVLPRLKKGNKYIMGNLNFWGGSPDLLPRSAPSLISLYQLMKKNRKMKIQIEGHVNGGIYGINLPEFQKESPESLQLLSDQRTETVFNYLKEKGIDTSRMSKVGYSDKFMLFPKPKNEYEHEANRRVEIKVLSLNND